MANRKKKEEALAVVQAQTEGSGQPAVQSGYSAAGLDSRSEVENALANSSYKPSQTVTDAADALKEWQANRPGDYQSSYQERIDQLLNQLLQRESFQYSYTKDPLYRQYEQNYLQNAHNASADAAAQAAALTGGYGSSYATSAAQQAYQQQIGALSSAIPTLYSLALDTYTSGGNELVSQLDQLNNSEQDAQRQYNNKLSDYYTQLKQKGEAYNNAYAQDYGQYQDYLSQLGTLHDYYSAQEQQQAARRQQVFSNVMTVLGVLGDAVQIVLSGTTGVGSMLSGLHLLRQPSVRGSPCGRSVEPAAAGASVSGQPEPAALRERDERAGVSGQTQPAEIQQRCHKPEAEHRTGRVEPEKVQCSAESKPRWQHGGRQ